MYQAENCIRCLLGFTGPPPCGERMGLFLGSLRRPHRDGGVPPVKVFFFAAPSGLGSSWVIRIVPF